MAWIKEKIADPRLAQTIHGWGTVIWFIAAFPICVFLSKSIPFLVFISVYAIVTGHWSAWQASRTEVEQLETNRKMEESDKI